MDTQNSINIKERSFWQTINPDLTIENIMYLSGNHAFGFASEMYEQFDQQMKIKGHMKYCVDPQDWRLPLDLMRLAIEKVVALGVLPIFVLVYDEFWMLFRRQQNMIEHFLGENYIMLPLGFWVWHVDPKRKGSWPPHRDWSNVKTLNDDGSPNSLTIWIPLSKASPLNSCMHVLPIEDDINYNKNFDTRGKSLLDASFLFRKGQALPADVGEVLVFNHDIIHWGSPANPLATEPRISISLEFQRGNLDPLFTPPLYHNVMPSFEIRLKLIATVIQRCTHMYQLDETNKQFTEEIVNTFGSL